MDHLDVPQILGLLVVMLAAAKLFGFLAQRIGQPAVLGELVAGVVLGMSVLGLVNPNNEVLHLLAEIGVVILLFEIGLETDLRKLVQVGGESAARCHCRGRPAIRPRLSRLLAAGPRQSRRCRRRCDPHRHQRRDYRSCAVRPESVTRAGKSDCSWGCGDRRRDRIGHSRCCWQV